MESRDCQAAEPKCKITTTVTVEKPCQSVTQTLKVVTSVTIDQMSHCESYLEDLPAPVDHKPVEMYFDHRPETLLQPSDNPPEPVTEHPDKNLCIDTDSSNKEDDLEMNPFEEFSAELFKVRLV